MWIYVVKWKRSREEQEENYFAEYRHVIFEAKRYRHLMIHYTHTLTILSSRRLLSWLTKGSNYISICSKVNDIVINFHETNIACFCRGQCPSQLKHAVLNIAIIFASSFLSFFIFIYLKSHVSFIFWTKLKMLARTLRKR